MDGIAYLGMSIHAVVLLVSAAMLLTVSALASGSEMAFFSLTPASVRTLRRGRTRAAQTIIELLADTERLLATLLIVNNLVNVGIVILTSAALDALFEIQRFEFLIKTVLVTFLLLLFGEILPKVMAQSMPTRFACATAPFVRVLRTLFYPVAWLLLRAGAHIGRGSKKSDLSIDDLAEAMDLTKPTSAAEQGMLTGIVHFVNTEVEEIMRPRVDVRAIPLDASYTAVKKEIIESGFSRIPIYEGDLDHVAGALYVKDLIPHIHRGDDFAWQKLIRKPYFVPEHKKINDLLADFQEQKIHMAIVVDEYGSTLGLVSLEDIIEEVVGEISDESDRDETFYTRMDEHTWIFDGKTHIGDFERVMALDEEALSTVQGRAETLAGLLLEIHGNFLRKGETVTAQGLRFEVTQTSGRRIDKIKVTKP